MDVTKEVEYCHKTFKNESAFPKFEEYIEKIKLADESTDQKRVFITALLEYAWHWYQFQQAMFVATYDNNPESLWALIITFLNRRLNSGRDISWTETFIDNLKSNSEFQLSKSDIKHFVTLIIKTKIAHFEKFKGKAILTKHEEAIKDEIVNQVKSIDFANHGQFLITFFPDLAFFNKLLKVSSQLENFDKLVFFVLTTYRKGTVNGTPISIQDVNYMMKTYSNEIANVAGALAFVIQGLVKIGYNEESGTLLLQLLKKQPPNAVNMTVSQRSSLEKIDLLEIKMHLYDTFKDTKYLPEEADIFLF